MGSQRAASTTERSHHEVHPPCAHEVGGPGAITSTNLDGLRTMTRSARSHPERPRPTSGRQVLPRAPGLAACDGRASRGVVRRARVRASPRSTRELDAERDAPSRLHGSGPTSGSVTTSAGDRRATYRERARVGRAPACDRAERSRGKRVGALLAAGSGATRALATDRRAAADAFGRAVAGSRAEPRDDRPSARSGARTRSTDDARPRPAVSDAIARDDQEQRDCGRRLNNHPAGPVEIAPT